MSDSGWSDYDDDDLESIGGSPQVRRVPRSSTVASPTATLSPRISPSVNSSPELNSFRALLLDHPRWKTDTSVFHVGFLRRRGHLSGAHDLKFVEIRGGLLRYMDVDSKHGSSVDTLLAGPATELGLLGASVARLSEESFTVSFPYKYQSRRIRSRVFKICSSGSLQSNVSDWIDAIRSASHWRFWARQLREPHPFKHRLCGVITFHVVEVKLDEKSGGGKNNYDPYVIVRFGDLRGRSSTMFKSPSQTSFPFDEFIQVPVEYDNPNWSILIRVMDESKIAEDALLGFAAIPLHALGINEERVWDFPLMLESGSTKTGKIACRTFYTSSLICQFLPLYPSHTHEPESIVAPHQVSMVTAKAHYARMVSIFNRCMDIREVFDDYIRFENSAVSVSGYCLLTFALLIVPHLSLLILFIVLGYAILARHPEAGNLPSGWLFFFSKSARESKHRLKRSNELLSVSSAATSTISVFECERRKWTVSASSLTQFSFSNLGPRESRWVGILGDSIDSSALKSVTDDDRRIIWNSVCGDHTDKNGWEYGGRFPEKNWLEMTREEEKSQWSKSYDSVRHRVRRRLWVGEIGGFVQHGELPLSLPETVDAENSFVLNKSHRFFELSDEGSPKSQGLLGRYYKLMEMLYRVQSGAGSASSRIEQLLNLFSWKSRWLTAIFFKIIIVCILASALVNPNVLLWLIATVLHYNGYNKWRSRTKRVRFFLKHLKEVVKQSNDTFRGVMGDILRLVKDPWKPFSETQVSKDLINLAVQKTVDKLQLGIALTLNDTKECACMYEIVRLVYTRKFGRKWASREVKTISFGNLTDQHLIGDWELYQPHSVFHHNSTT